MFRIRDFSRFTKVSVKMLRHYDQLGLFRPARVDPETRYRYYTAAQLPELHRILALKDLGFSLEAIAGILEDEPSPADLSRLLELRSDELRQRIGEDRRRLARVESRLRGLERGEPADLDVVVRDLEAVRVARLRRRVAQLDEGVQRMFETVEETVAATGHRAFGSPVLIYHDRDYRERDASVEVAVPVEPGFRTARGVRAGTLPAVSGAACVVYRGDYDQLPVLLGRLLGWIESQRLRIAGPMREVYHVFRAGNAEKLRLPAEFLSASVEDFVTEVQVPVRARRKDQP